MHKGSLKAELPVFPGKHFVEYVKWFIATVRFLYIMATCYFSFTFKVHQTTKHY